MDRIQAIKNKTKIYNGKICSKHNTTERYVSSYHCVYCTQESTNNRDPNVYKKYLKSEKGRKFITQWRRSTTNRSIQNRWKKKHYESKPEQYFGYGLKKYNLTTDEYWKMFEKQGGVCKVCEEPPTVRKLAVDHDHRTGEVRGLLCGKCNTALGLLREDKNIIDKLKEYV